MPPRKGRTQLSATRLQSQITKVQDSSFFLSSIRDPNNPLHCGICIDGAFTECTKDLRGAVDLEDCPPNQKSTLPKRDPVVWNAIVGFMFHRRTDEEVKRLLDRMSVCTCRINGQSRSIERYHQLALWNMKADHYECRATVMKTQTTPPVLETFTTVRCGWVLDIFQDLSLVVTNIRLKAAAKASANNWPNSLTDLFPFGPDSLVQSMLQWYHHVPDPVIFYFMGVVIHASQMLVVPSLIKHRFTHTIVQVTRQMLDRAMIDVLDLKDATTIQVKRTRFFGGVGCALPYFGLAKAGQIDLLNGCETKIVQLLSIIIYLTQEWDGVFGREANEDINIRGCAAGAMQIYRLFNMHQSPPFPVHPLLDEMDVKLFNTFWASPPPENGIVLVRMRECRRNQQCSAKGCTNSLQTAGQSFQRCGRCGIVSYCGRECQMKAWKYESYPHKLVCSALKNLVEKGGGSSFFFSGDMKNPSTPTNALIFEKILQDWKRAKIDSDLVLVDDWMASVEQSKDYHMPNGTECSPGYDDYEEVIARLSKRGMGVKPVYLDRTSRWPPDVEKDKRLLQMQPFWGQEVDFH